MRILLISEDFEDFRILRIPRILRTSRTLGFLRILGVKDDAGYIYSVNLI